MSWHTKEDVLDDLAQLMGNSVKELDEQCFAIGEQPPPQSCTINELDDEMYLRLQENGEGVVAIEDGKGPDLNGITEMLRMVDKFNSSSKDENELNNKVSNDAGITITKYNLKAPEFVPKPNSIDSKINEVERKKENNIINFHNKNCKKSEIDLKVDSAKLKEISDDLKNKISSKSKAACIHVKRERNLAIASLLKLYSNNASICDTKPKLFTPEHFEKSSNEKQLAVESYNPQPNISSSVASLESGSVGTVQSSEGINDVDLEIEESVAKVNNWLSNANSQKVSDNKEPALFLGPVTFKKRASKKEKGPKSEASDKSQNQKGNSFVPSEYASKLSQSYMERVKAKEDRSLDFWGKLERDLKAKDEEVMKKQQLANKSKS